MAVKYLKRKSAMSSRKVYRPKRRFGPKKSFMQVKNIRGVVNKVLARKIETKQSTYAPARYLQIKNNQFVTVDDQFLTTTQGTADPMAGNGGNRIGDEITLKGVSLKFLLELNERFGDVTCRIMLVRSARGDVPTIANLFANVSVNKIMDRINTERYTIVASKYVKLLIGNSILGLTATEQGTAAQPAGVYYSNAATHHGQRPTKMVRMYIPGRKFARNGTIRYENASDKVKFFDHTLVVYAYANYSTHLGGVVDTLNIAAVADYVKTMYYTDA